MKVRSYYYKAPRKFKRKYMVNHLISIWTTFVNLWRVHPKKWKEFCKLGISHEEFSTGDEGEFDSHTPGGHGVMLGLLFSSTKRDGADGVRVAWADTVLRHPENWLYVEYDRVERWRFDLAENMMRRLLELNEGYDTSGVAAGFTNPFNFGDDPDKWYCSAICWVVKWCAGVVNKRKARVSPLWSAWQAIQAGNELKPLAMNHLAHQSEKERLN